jgi:Fe-S-cluster-containing dehydrogenase component
MSEFGRVIDLDRCIGCRACVAACNVENHCDEQTSWQVVLSQEVGQFPNVKELFTPMGCMHCRDAPCEKVCDEIDIHAISTNEFGVVIFDQNKCIGCGYCEAVCPYGVPRFAQQRNTIYGDEGATAYDKLDKSKLHPLQQHKTGKAQKCTFCFHKIEAAQVDGKLDRVGIDPKYTPSCDLVCPVDARIFGDLADNNSAVSKAIGQKNAQPMKKEFGTSPRVYYIGGS